MLKAQDGDWKLYKVDIESKITLTSLALSILSMKDYEANPHTNEDSLRRRAYDHTDTYKPYGEDLYAYELHPFVMKECTMPGSVPVWHGKMEGMDVR